MGWEGCQTWRGQRQVWKSVTRREKATDLEEMKPKWEVRERGGSQVAWWMLFCCFDIQLGKLGLLPQLLGVLPKAGPLTLSYDWGALPVAVFPGGWPSPSMVLHCSQLLPLSPPAPSFPFHGINSKSVPSHTLCTNLGLSDCLAGKPMTGGHPEPLLAFRSSLDWEMKMIRPGWRWKSKVGKAYSRFEGLLCHYMAYSAQQVQKDCLHGKTRVVVTLGTCTQRP